MEFGVVAAVYARRRTIAGPNRCRSPPICFAVLYLRKIPRGLRCLSICMEILGTPTA